MGIWEFKLPEDGDDAESVAKLKASGLHGDDDDPGHALDLSGAVPRDPTIPPSARPSCAPRSAASRRSSPRSCSASRALRPPTVDPDEARRVIVEGFKQAAQVAAEHGLTLGMEPLHRTIYGTWTTVFSIPRDDRPDGRDRRAERASSCTTSTTSTTPTT